MIEDNLKKLESVTSSERLDNAVLRAAHSKQRAHTNNTRPASVSGFSLLVGFAFGVCFAFIFAFNFFVNEEVPFVVDVPTMTTRGNAIQNTQIVDLRTLTLPEQKDLAIELLMMEKYEEALVVTNWIDQHKKEDEDAKPR